MAHRAGNSRTRGGSRALFDKSVHITEFAHHWRLHVDNTIHTHLHIAYAVTSGSSAVSSLVRVGTTPCATGVDELVVMDGATGARLEHAMVTNEWDHLVRVYFAKRLVVSNSPQRLTLRYAINGSATCQGREGEEFRWTSQPTLPVVSPVNVTFELSAAGQWEQGSPHLLTVEGEAGQLLPASGRLGPRCVSVFSAAEFTMAAPAPITFGACSERRGVARCRNGAAGSR